MKANILTAFFRLVLLTAFFSQPIKVAAQSASPLQFFYGAWKTESEDGSTAHFVFYENGYVFIYDDGELLSGNNSLIAEEYDEDAEDYFSGYATSTFQFKYRNQEPFELTITVWVYKTYRKKTFLNEREKQVMSLQLKVLNSNQISLKSLWTENSEDGRVLSDDDEEVLILRRTIMN